MTIKYTGDVVTVQTTIENLVISRVGFGVGAFYCYHDFWPALSREFSSTADMAEAGVPTDHQAYRFAQVYFSQAVKPEKLKILKRRTVFDHEIDFTVLSTFSEGEVLTGEVSDGGDWLTWEYEVAALDDTSDIATGVAAAINALAGLTCAAAAAVGTIESDTQGQTIRARGWPTGIVAEDVTPTAGVAADFDAIDLVDTDWYNVASDLQSEVDIEAMAAAIETREKIFLTWCSQPALLTTPSDNVAFDLKALSYNNTCITYHHEIGTYGEAGHMGRQITQPIGSTTAAGKAFVGVSFSSLSPAQISNLTAVRCNYYTEKAGGGHYMEEINPAGEFIGNISVVHWINARLIEQTILALRSQEKVPYSDAGFAYLETFLRVPFDEMVKRTGFLDDPAPVITMPLRSSIEGSQAQTRELTGITAKAYLAGAIHRVRPIVVKLSVQLP